MSSHESSLQKPTVSIIIPVYNEEKRVLGALKEVRDFFDRSSYSFDIIVVDDGSIDSTPHLVKDHESGVHLISYRTNRGKGYAVRRGFLEATGDLILMTDSDLSTPIEEFYRLLPFMEEGFHIAIGSRGLKESKIERYQPIHRVIAGRVYNYLLRLLRLTEFHDTQCGFKLFQRRPCMKIFEMARVDGFGFDVEILYLAHKFGLKIKEVPVRWFDSNETKVRFLWDSLAMLRDSLLLKVRDWFGIYRIEEGRAGGKIF